MSELAMLGAMTPVEIKQMEQARIAPVLGAVAALPGLGLVYGAAPGAPFFAAALVFVAASYAFWILVDAFYYQQVMALRSPHARLIRRGPERWAYRFYWPMIGYAVASIAATLAGFAAMHGAVTTPVPLWAGFALMAAAAAGVAAHVLYGMAARNVVFRRVRRTVERGRRLAARREGEG